MSRMLTLAFLLPSLLFGQPEGRFVDKGLLRADGAFSIGVMPHYPGKNIYLNGSLEYYVDDNVSIRSESYLLLQGNGVLDQNHSLFTGGFWHFKTSSGFDPYIGFQPGISLAQPAPLDYYVIQVGGSDTLSVEHIAYPANPSPVIALSTGFNYYASKFFHLFIHVKYVHGQYLSDLPAVRLNEVKIAFGLGWNLRLKKKE